MSKVIALFTTANEFMGNRALNTAYMSQYHGGQLIPRLAELAQEAGYDFMTADVFMESRPSTEAFLISTDGYPSWAPRGVFVPAVCAILEVPLIAWRLYHNLYERVNSFKHVFLYSGTKSRLAGAGCSFHSIYWPNEHRTIFEGIPWENREHLVLINSNKTAFGPLSYKDGIVKFSKLVMLTLYRKFVRLIDPWFKSDLYKERLKAIEYFGHYHWFSLFGEMWDQPIGKSEKKLRPFIDKCWQGRIPPGNMPKLDVLRRFKFAICFENTCFPGCITEKIFDCFFSGCIPIYWGAPDISDNVPPETFIDFRNFSDYEDLKDYLMGISKVEVNNYLVATREFILSDKFNRFHVDDSARRILAAVQDVVADHL